MADQLLATFHVQSPDFLYGDLTVTARVQYQSGTGATGATWYENTNQLRCVVTNAHYDDDEGLRRRYKIEVFRTETSAYYDGQYVLYYPIHKADTYKRRLQILFNGSVVLERMLYITIQPNLHVYVEDGRQQTADGSRERIDLVHTEETVISVNPLVKTMEVKTNNSAAAVAARNMALTQPNAYKKTVFVKSNLPIDLVCNDLTDNDTITDQWLQLKDTVTVTRKIKNNEYKWRNI